MSPSHTGTAEKQRKNGGEYVASEIEQENTREIVTSAGETSSRAVQEDQQMTVKKVPGKEQKDPKSVGFLNFIFFLRCAFSRTG